MRSQMPLSDDERFVTLFPKAFAEDSWPPAAGVSPISHSSRLFSTGSRPAHITLR